jgi:hypothetical protein
MRAPKNIPPVRLELGPSLIDRGGVGVFAAREIACGSLVADGVAKSDFKAIVPWIDFDVFDARLKRKVMAFCVGTPEGFIPPPGFDFNKLSIEWYFNHSCQGNCGFDANGDFVAIRDIAQGAELCYDYALIESNPNFTMRCACGAQRCREVVTGNDWKDDEFVSKNLEHMHPYLRRLLPVPA